VQVEALARPPALHSRLTTGPTPPPPHHQVSPHARAKDLSTAKYISILNIIQGEVDPTQVGGQGTCVSRAGP
jgi:hypothetical protein